MVKHHVKKKGSGRNKESKSNKAEEDERIEDLNRFAGSSDEEDDRHDESDVHVVANDGATPTPQSSESPTTEESEQRIVAVDKAGPIEEEGSDGSDSDDVAAATSGSAGMAGAMARILGASSSGAKAPVILSKTITPLQKLHVAEKRSVHSARDERMHRRNIHLQAMHVPLLGDDTERKHRRIATRGVVALFNAIATHQQQRNSTLNPTQGTNKTKTAASSSSFYKKDEEQLQSMSKYGFLDMLKKKGIATNAVTTTTTSNGNNEDDKKKDFSNAKFVDKRASLGWNALKDDFMLKSKLKDWDKQLTDDDDDDSDDDNLSDNNDDNRRTQGGGDGDSKEYDDDWSDDDDVKKRATPLVVARSIKKRKV